MKIGIIQTRGLGDIVIAAPIAMYYIERGCDIYWPIDSDFVDSFEYAFPKINFIPVYKNETGINTSDYFYTRPKEILQNISCNATLCLYSHLTGFDFGQGKLSDAISFDAYKYAIAKVPFSEKWKLKIKRNPLREAKLFEVLNLNPNENYAVIHDQGSVHNANMDNLITPGTRNIKISAITNNFLDWLGVIENSDSAYLVNSVYSNLVEQMNMDIKKFLYIHTTSQWTPVFVNNWTYIHN